jgi:hypothetical protein
MTVDVLLPSERQDVREPQLGSEGGDGHSESDVVAGVLQPAPQVLDRNRDGALDNGLARQIPKGIECDAAGGPVGRQERGLIRPTAPTVTMAKAMNAAPAVLTAVLAGMAEGVSIKALAATDVPVLIVNGRGDLANQRTERILAALPQARSLSCDGDHVTTPFQPAFHRAVIDFLAEQW